MGRIPDSCLDGIIARLYNQADLDGMAEHADAPVISAMTDAEHPCQVLADLLTIREQVGEDAKVTYIGDGNNVCNSWILAAAVLQLDLRLVIPEGYEPKPAVLKPPQAMGGKPLSTTPINVALSDSDAIYTDVCTSMCQQHEHERRRRDFGDYQVNSALL